MAPGPQSAPQAATAPLPFTRKEFFALAAECRAYATALAARDQRHVYVDECRKMNHWLRRLKQYDRLGPRLAGLKPARPIARWQVATLTLALWLVLYLYVVSRDQPTAASLILNGTILLLLIFYFLPERVFGTTIEGLEGKILRVVDVMEEMLRAGEMGFSEAAYFQARDNLAAAHAELRQQIDLAHRE